MIKFLSYTARGIGRSIKRGTLLTFLSFTVIHLINILTNNSCYRFYAFIYKLFGDKSKFINHASSSIVNRINDALRSNGYYVYEELIIVKKINQEIDQFKRYEDPDFKVEASSDYMKIAHYSSIDLMRSNLIQNLIKELDLHKIADKYSHDSRVKIMSIQCIETPPKYGLDATQLLHSDHNIGPAPKFFLYLTDVLENEGHTLVEKTIMRPLRYRYRIRYSDEDCIEEFGYEKIKSISGKAGTAFWEDTNMLHRGSRFTTKKRRVLIIHFGFGQFAL